MAEIVRTLRIEVKTNELATAKKEVNLLEKELKEFRKATDNGSKATNDQSKRLADLSVNLKAARNRYNDLEASVLKNNDALRKNSGFVAGVKKGMVQFATSAAGMAVGVYGISRAFMSSITTIKDFEQAMAQVRAVTKASNDEFKKLQDDALKIGAASKFSAVQVAGLQEELAKLGFSTSEVVNSTEGIVIAATATGDSLENMAGIIGSTIRSFGLSTTETNRVADVLAQTLNLSAMALDDFRDSMKYVAPVAKAAGVSIEETSAMLGVLSDAGIKGGMAGTSLRRILVDMAKSGKEPKEALAQLATTGITLTGAMDEVGRSAQTSLLVLANNMGKVDEFTKGLQNASGAAKETADIMLDTLAGDIELLKSSWEGFVLSFNNGEGKLSKGFRKLVQFSDMLVGSLRSLNDTTTEGERINDVRIQSFKDILHRYKDQNAAINNEVKAEKNLLKTKKDKIEALRAERKLLVLNTQENNHARYVIDTQIKQLTKQANGHVAYINALGGVRKELIEVVEVEEESAEATGAQIEVDEVYLANLDKKSRMLEAVYKKIAKDIEDSNKKIVESERKREDEVAKITQEAIARREAEIDTAFDNLSKNVDDKYKILDESQQLNIETRQQMEIDALQERAGYQLLSAEQREKAEADIVAKYENIKRQERFETAAAIGGLLDSTAQLMKEGSIAQKVLLTAGVVMNTYAAAAAALAPPPIGAGPVLGPILAGTAIVNGLASVAKINAVQFADGGRVPQGQNIPTQSNGDNVLATVKTGEVVLNQRQQQLIGGAPTFRRAGVPGFANGGVVGADIPASVKGMANGKQIVKVIQVQRDFEKSQKMFKVAQTQGDF